MAYYNAMVHRQQAGPQHYGNQPLHAGGVVPYAPYGMPYSGGSHNGGVPNAYGAMHNGPPYQPAVPAPHYAAVPAGYSVNSSVPGLKNPNNITSARAFAVSRDYTGGATVPVAQPSARPDGLSVRGQYWLNDQLLTGFAPDGRLYINGGAVSGDYKGTEYQDGLCFAGINPRDGLMYSNYKPACCQIGDKLYNKGRPAEGLLALRSGVTKMFEDGRRFTGQRGGLYYVDGLAPNFLDSEMMAAQKKVETKLGKFHLTPQEKAEAWQNAPSTVNPSR